uniref:hypothetical protein n=1 Tax=Deinococcus alpinitundrae TaxID=468913 RepID=UPI001ED95976
RGAPRGVISRNESAECRSRRTFLHETINRNISVRQHLDLPKISSVRRVEDTDNEPLSQAADVIAYGHFRDELFQVRLKNGQQPLFEPMLEAARIRWGPPRICSADVGHIWRRKRLDRRYDQISVAAMYSTAFYELQKFHPDFTNQYLV